MQSKYRPRRWEVMLGIYLALLIASHIVRLLQPADGVPRPEERTVELHAIRGERETRDTVHLALLDLKPKDTVDPPVVLLIHGSPGDNEAFWSVAPTLARQYRVLAVDLPGFGGSTRQIPDYSIRAHARYLRALLDSLGVRQAHLVGFSLGGGVALELVRQAPERVRSLILLSSIGAQEYELLGDYHLNHGIHGLQLAGLWLLSEATPHFGWFDHSMLSVEYARNFYDTDQRPLRGILQRVSQPTLIIHGAHDPLVTPACALESHRLVPQSKLLMTDRDHFMVFMEPDMVAEPIAAFVAGVERGEEPDRAAAAPDRVAQAGLPFDPRSLPRTEGLALSILLVLLVAGTLVSEDLTCIAAGLMVAHGRLNLLSATLACLIGIFVGDLLLFGSGRLFGRLAIRTPPFSWFLTEEDLNRASQWFSRQGARLIFASRFLPGTRLPTYFAAGMLRTSVWTFSFYFLLAALAWTPLLVALSALFGTAIQHSLGVLRRDFALYLLVGGLFLLLVVKLLIPLCSYRGRRLLVSAWRRKRRWEFWPRWMFYPPVVLYILFQALRHRSLLLFTAANPAIPAGGFVGESKGDILRGLAGSPEYVARTAPVPAALAPEERLSRVREFMAQHGYSYPIVLKPDIGERGSGVAIIRTDEEAQDFVDGMADDALVQEYVPGEEFGVFYYRHRQAERGTIFSITEKRFPAVMGDGASTLEELILADERAVCMAPFYLRKHAARLFSVPSKGERVQLVELGTHCRGAAFFDGAWVGSAALEEVIDRISRGFDGFHFGRYDIRTASVAEFHAGRNFKIVELNGVTAEATHIYDPANRLTSAYRTLFTQWRILFEIAEENRRAGARPATIRELLRLVREHRRAIRGHRE